MLDLLKQDLEQKGAFNGELPTILKDITNAISNQDIPFRMKLAIATSELILFASHMRRNIAHWNGSFIPINAITFSIASSGSGKDSSVNAARKCFDSGYKLLDKKRKTIALEQAIKSAVNAGKENPEEWSSYKEFYLKPNPLFVAPSTPEGFIQHLNDLDEAGTGAGFIYSGEFGAELATSTVLVENIKLLAEIYDEGSKEVKVLKSRENQSKEIKNLPVSALFVGSQDNLLFDDAIKRRFKTEFSTKLARRAFFNYSPETIEPPTYADIPEAERVAHMVKVEMEIEDHAKQARAEVDEKVSAIAGYNLSGVGKPLPVDEEAREIFLIYKRYNAEIAKTIKAQYPIAKLTRLHLQWKALKLAGAIAIFENHSSIKATDYSAAISYCEMLDKDMQMFEAELVKESYEIFVDFVHNNAEDGKFSLGLHTLRKLGYIPQTGAPTTKMKELVHLASSYDKEGIYTVCPDGICYEKQVRTDIAGVSYIEVSGTKEERMKKCSSGYTFYETDFEDLGPMLTFDYAYTPFQFKDGKRCKENILGGCKWIVLDIDDSAITDEEAHFLLMDINHHIARTSDKDNAFKFRILIELSSMVDIPDIQWKHFMKCVSEDLSLNADLLPKSQIYFSYEDRTVLSVTDAEPLDPKTYIMESADILATKELTVPKKLSSVQQKAQLDDPLTTFGFAFEASNGRGSIAMIGAARKAFQELGATRDETVELVNKINSYWDESMPEQRLEATIVSQIRRW